jgi:hypothetical protein
MRLTRGWTGLPTAVIALGILTTAAPRAHAAATDTNSNSILEYSVAGAIGTSGVSGQNVISFIPVQQAQIDPTSNLPLGSFQVAPLPPGQTTTYSDTPFNLTLVPTSFDGGALNTTPITVSGHLDGMVSGKYQSSVQVTFDLLTNGSFGLGGGTSSLSVLQNDHKLLVPSSAGGLTTLEGQLSSTGIPSQSPVPEPSTIALFLSTIGGLGLRKYVLARRPRALA